MHLKFFGDSYDIVKKFLISSLSTHGAWFVHPMFTEEVSPSDAFLFSRLIGAELVSCDVLTTLSNRAEYLRPCLTCGNLFLDPDTGLRLNTTRSKKAPAYLFADELLWIARARPQALTMVFDQSLPRGSERQKAAYKMTELAKRGIYSFAYVSHMAFLVSGRDHDVIDSAYADLRDKSLLPESRLLRL